MNPSRPNSRRPSAGGSLTAVLISACLALTAPGAVAQADTGDVGYQDGSTTGTGSATGTKRPESALWFNDGLWWANMWDRVSKDFHIFRLNAATQSWSDTSVRIDSRSGTSADTLWDGTHLYVSSHIQSSTAASGNASYLFRYSYNPVSRTYALDSGFPTQINDVSSETLVIAKDSTGRLWATWQQGSRIYVNRTLGDDRTWGAPFVLPASGTSVAGDDISSIVAFGGNKIGVLWGNQASSQDGFYFAVHDDAQPDTTWRATETAWRGSNVADDHINLKADSKGRVYAAVKTSLTGSSAALTALLARDPSTGQWSHATVDTAGNCPNRPTVIIDEASGVAHVFQTGPAAPDFTCSDDGGDIYEKTAPLGTLIFQSGRGTVVMRDADAHQMHNNTSTKQTVGPASGLVALAVERSTNRYWHSFNALGGSVAPVADFTGSPRSGSAPLAVAFTDLSSGSRTSWSWNFGDGATASVQNPSHTYSAPGAYTVSLTVTGPGGSDIETKSGYITVGTPGAPVTFTPVADTRVEQANPTLNLGDHTTLRVKRSSSSSYESYVRFTVAGLTRPVVAAKLRLWVRDTSPDGGSLYRVSDDWDESAITWNARPPISGTPVAAVGSVGTAGTWVEVDLTGTVTGNGTYSFGMKSASSDTAYFSSKEGSDPPQLVVTPAA